MSTAPIISETSVAVNSPQGPAVNPPAPSDWYQRMVDRQIERARQEQQAHKMTHCSRCRRILKDAESIRLGIGPECRRKGAK